jgi:hypothetical protein
VKENVSVAIAGNSRNTPKLAIPRLRINIMGTCCDIHTLMGSDNETRNKTHPLLGKSFVNMNNIGSIARDRTHAAM